VASTARSYHEATKHSFQSVRRRGHFMDWSNKPHPFKVYEGLPQVQLPRQVRGIETSALDALRRIGTGASATPHTVEDLARLLFLAAGVVRAVEHGDEVLYFRTYASAGALYPVEVYVASDLLPGLDAGLYRFDPRGVALTRLREGDHRAWLVRASGREPSVATAPLVLILTGIPWRTAWKYSERGYRHLFWDAGMILANLLAAAASADLPARTVLGFADGEVEALLGLDGRHEFPLCLVPLGSGPSVKAAPLPPERVELPAQPLSPREQEFDLIRQANDAGRLDVTDAPSWRSSFTPRSRPDPRPPEPVPGEPRDSLEEVIRRRGSARVFGPAPIPAVVLKQVLEIAVQPIPSDYAPGGAMLVEPYLIAAAAGGLTPGAYAFRDGTFELLREGNFRREAAYLCLEQRLAADAAATIFLMADLDAVMAALGDRGYRAAQQEGGIVGGRIYLAAYAHRFGATGLTFYDDDVTEFFSPHAAGKSCMLVVAVGESPRLTSTRRVS
jgi:SagB-type dehydrogenase family enzyme